MRSKQPVLSSFAILFFAFFCVVSYATNIYKLASADWTAPYKTEGMRMIGIFPPVGVIIGFMDIGEEVDD